LGWFGDVLFAVLSQLPDVAVAAVAAAAGKDGDQEAADISEIAAVFPVVADRVLSAHAQFIDTCFAAYCSKLRVFWRNFDSGRARLNCHCQYRCLSHHKWRLHRYMKQVVSPSGVGFVCRPDAICRYT
jgi:hypothetical protein